MAGSNQQDRLVDQYKLEHETGQDQLRDHYSGYEVDTGKPVSVTILKQEFAGDDLFVQNYLRRTRSLTQVRHPNLTTYLQTGLFEENFPYVAMEPVSGFTLGERLDRLAQGQVPAHPIYALTLVQQIASGLALLERLELFHYELTPNHIQLKSVTLKSEESVIVTDLDIPDQYAGKFFEYSEYTANYLSPEQLSGVDFDGRSHVYTLGVVLQELLCGERPHQPVTWWRKMWSTLSGGSTLEKLSPDLSAETYALVERSLQKNRRRRYSSLKDFQEALDGALAIEYAPVPVETTEPTRGPWPFFLVPLVLLLFCGILGLLGLWLLPGLRNTPGASLVVASENPTVVVSATATSPADTSPTPITTPTMMATMTPTEQFIRRTSAADEDVSGVLPAPDQVTSSPVPSKTATIEPTITETAPVLPSETPTSTPTPEAAFLVQSDSANVRLGPGIVYDPIGYVYKNEELAIIGRSYGKYIWLNVLTESGHNGWVAADVGELIWPQELTTIETAATIPPPPTATYTPTPTETPLPPTPTPPTGSGSGGGNGGSSGNDKPRSTPTPPF